MTTDERSARFEVRVLARRLEGLAGTLAEAVRLGQQTGGLEARLGETAEELDEALAALARTVGR